MAEHHAVTVAIIDHNNDFLEKSLVLLRKDPGIQVCASHLLTNFHKDSAIADKAVDDVVRCQPRVLLLSQIILREAAALDLKSIIKIRDKVANMRTVIIIDHYVEEAALIGIREGIRGLYMRKIGPSQIVSCVHNVARGEVWLEARLISRLIEEFSKLYKHVDSLQPPTRGHEAKLPLLSRREMEILGLVSKSYTNADIAKTLFISEKTVKTHIKNIFEKTGVKNRVEATLLLVRSGLTG
jgi:DNA-binding NarL/FixJ family response regulator